MNETTLLHRLMLAFTKARARVFRNHVGLGWQGRHTIFRSSGTVSLRVNPGDVFIEKARPLHAGLCTGSSDLVGWNPVQVTPELVGKTIAVFMAVEAKTEHGKLSEEQSNFLAAVRDAGGIAIEARNVDAAVEVLRGALRG